MSSVVSIMRTTRINTILPRRICSFGGCQSVALTDSSRCEKHTRQTAPKRSYAHHYHQGKHIYTSARWIALRDAHRLSHPCCELCERRGIYRPVDVVDHVKEISQGGEPFDPENLMSLCSECHHIKTGKEAKKVSKRRKNNGFGCLNDY